MSNMQRNGSIDGCPYEFYAEYDTVATQDAILIPGGIKLATFTLEPLGGGSSKLQATTAPESQINDGTAVWVDHPDGAVSSTLQGKVEAVTAIRVVVASGTASLSIRAS